MSHTSRPFAIVIFAVIASALVVGLSISLAYLNQSPGIHGQTRVFTVARGSSSTRVANDLADSGYIKSAMFFKVLLRVSPNKASIKHGSYLIRPGQTSFSILSDIQDGRFATARVSIPEGLSLKKIARLLEENAVCQADDFILASHDRDFLAKHGVPFSDAEGLLYPDTYIFPLGSAATEVLDQMLETFKAKLGTLYPIDDMNESFRRSIIIASLIEKEYRVNDEAPLISSVIHNRLKIGMALQIDACIVYIIEERRGRPHPEVIYYADLDIKDPYNTYRYPDLPPGPICNPGLVAIQAALNPAESDYLYYRLVDPALGRHHFSKTLAEHDAAASLLVDNHEGK